MLFYQTRRTNMPSTRRGVARPFITAEPGGGLHITPMLKGFATGCTLFGLLYLLVQLAGFQYLASLTSVTLFAFLLAYLVWCILHRNNLGRQRSDGSSRTETAHMSPTVGDPVPMTPDPPPPFDYQQTFKYVTRTPDRDQSPPPTYEEAIQAMMLTATSTLDVTCHLPVSPGTVSRPFDPRVETTLASPISTVSVPTLNPSTTQLWPSVLMSSSPPSALSCSLSSSSLSVPHSSPVVQTHSPFTLQRLCFPSLSQSEETLQPSAILAQTSPTALPPASTVLLTPSEHPAPHTGEVSCCGDKV